MSAALVAPLATAVVLLSGAYVVAVADAVMWARVAGVGSAREVLARPVRTAALLVAQRPAATERPDVGAGLVAPALYAALAAAGIAVVPWTPSYAIADVEAGIVLWGGVEALVIVAVFLHGWAPNSLQPLLGAYRYVAAGLSWLLLSMFVLIAVALPAQSLGIGAIVEAQSGLWNAVRQPLGLPLFLVVALGSATWGPLDLAGGNDLSGGTSAEVSGRERLAWLLGRAAMLTAFAAMSATLFLGGWQGPLLPGPVWVAVKTLAVLGALVAAGHLFARVRAERFVTWCWTVLLPLAFVDLAIAGIEALR